MKKIFYILFLFPLLNNAQSISVLEDFSQCSFVNGWSTNILDGNAGFEIATNNQVVVSTNTCMIQYKQNDPQNLARKRFQLISPEFNLVSGVTHYLVFNYKYLRTFTSNFNLIYDGPKGKVTLALSPVTDYTNYYLYIPYVSGYTKTKFTFEYDITGNDAGNQIYLDDLLFTSDQSDCSRAQELMLDVAAINSSTYPYQYYLSGTQSCTGEYSSALWFKYQSNYTGLVELVSETDFNNSIVVYEGACGGLTELNCNNKDEYGFTGERVALNVTQGKTYFFKTSRKINDFGRENGLQKLSIKKLTKTKVTPLNDICASKKLITVNGNCEKNNNYNAGIESQIPSTNTRSRADVWYSFIAPATIPISIISHADFAEVITLYQGNCNALQQLAVEDFGGKLNYNVKQGVEYFVQISGYFSTVEGDICVEVKDNINAKPANDECFSASPIALNTQCTPTQFLNNNISSRKPSCVVYSAPDVWYSFVATDEKQVALRVDAGFIYSYAVYEGAVCTNLTEIACGQMTDPCNGFINVKGLTSGKKYYLQIMANSYPLKAAEGRLCVRIDETSKTEAFDKLNLSLNSECLHGVLTHVNYYTVRGGKANYVYTGPSIDDYFSPGQTISAFVDDAHGCRAFAQTEANCTGGSKCKNSNLDIQLSTDCVKDSLGLNIGEVVLNFNGTGGSGAYYYYGTASGTKLKHGDSYKVILIDSDSCYVIEEGKINCPPFNCAQSNLKLAVTYDCVDTLLKARIKLDVSGAVGNYSLQGAKDGDLLSQGANYNVAVVDAANCSTSNTGMINCHFDSCAYSRPNLVVGFTCLKDSIGNTSGLAELTLYATSYAGGISFIGNKQGDILKHKDAYKVEMIDAFGCNKIVEGIVNCVPLSTNNPNLDTKISLIPNPNNGQFYLNFESEHQGYIEISIYNTEGKIILSSKEKVNQGINSIPLNIEEQSAGIYFVRLQSGQLKAVLKLVKI